MLNFIFRAIVLVLAAGSLTTGSASESLTAHIPFQFRVGTSQMSSGDYYVRTFSEPVGLQLCRSGGACVSVQTRIVPTEVNLGTARFSFFERDGVHVLGRISAPNRPTREIVSAQRPQSDGPRRVLRRR